MGRKSRRTGLHSRRQARAFASGFSRTHALHVPLEPSSYPVWALLCSGELDELQGHLPERQRVIGRGLEHGEGGRNSEASSLKVGEARLPAIADDKFPSGTGPPNARHEPDTRATRCRTCRRPSPDAAHGGHKAPEQNTWAERLLRPPRPVPSSMEPPRPHTALRRPYGGNTPVH